MACGALIVLWTSIGVTRVSHAFQPEEHALLQFPVPTHTNDLRSTFPPDVMGSKFVVELAPHKVGKWSVLAEGLHVHSACNESLSVGYLASGALMDVEEIEDGGVNGEVCARIAEGWVWIRQSSTYVAQRLMDAPLDGPDLVFVKTFKTGGSTFSGDVRRIGHALGYAHVRELSRWLKDNRSVEAEAETDDRVVAADHGQRQEVDEFLSPRNGIPRFYMSIVRDPVERCMSAFYHFHSLRDGADENDTQAKVQALQDCQLKWQTMAWNMCADEPCSDAAHILESYDFVAVTEKFDESLVLLRRRLGVHLTDVLYLASKISGEAATDGMDRGKTQPHHPELSEEPAVVQEAAARFASTSCVDGELFKQATVKLEEEIAAEGPDFKEELGKFKEMLRLVTTKCAAHFFEDCYVDDYGCGESCIDQLIEEEHWKE